MNREQVSRRMALRVLEFEDREDYFRIMQLSLVGGEHSSEILEEFSAAGAELAFGTIKEGRQGGIYFGSNTSKNNFSDLRQRAGLRGLVTATTALPTWRIPKSQWRETGKGIPALEEREKIF